MASSSAGSHSAAGGHSMPRPLLRPRMRPGTFQRQSLPLNELTVALCVPLGAALLVTVGQVLGEGLCDCEVGRASCRERV